MYSLPTRTTLAALTMASAASMAPTSPLVSTIPSASMVILFGLRRRGADYIRRGSGGTRSGFSSPAHRSPPDEDDIAARRFGATRARRPRTPKLDSSRAVPVSFTGFVRSAQYSHLAVDNEERADEPWTFLAHGGRGVARGARPAAGLSPPEARGGQRHRPEGGVQPAARPVGQRRRGDLHLAIGADGEEARPGPSRLRALPGLAQSPALRRRPRARPARHPVGAGEDLHLHADQ